MYGKRIVMNETTKRKISNSLKESKVFQASRKSKEYREKISRIQSSPIYILDEHMAVIGLFDNCRKVAEHFGCTRGNIKNARRDKRMVQGKYWVIYKNDYENGDLNEYFNKIP